MIKNKFPLNHSVSLFLVGIFVLVVGIMGFIFDHTHRWNYLLLGGISTVFFMTVFLMSAIFQETVSCLFITPTTITVTYKKFLQKTKETIINVKDVDTLNIHITQKIGRAGGANSFPYQIEFSFLEKSGFQNYFCITKGNYNIVFQIYDGLLNIVPHIHIKATGKHADIIQADIDTYLKHKKRIPLLLRFGMSLNKREKVEIIVFLSILFIFSIPLLFLFLR